MADWSGADEERYIVKKSVALGIDPEAELAVAAHEGVTLPAEVGDSGHSFGPNQLYSGGALPAAIWAKGADFADHWANSPEGIDYALNAIAGVARGKKGYAAVHAIVYEFEHPADPASETAAAWRTYQAGQGPTVQDKGTGTVSVGGILNGAGSVAGDIAGIVVPGAGDLPGILGGVFSGPFKGIEKLIVRGFFIFIGLGVLLIGLYLIVRAFGLNAGAAPAAFERVYARTTPTGRAAHAARKTTPRRRGDAAAGRGEAVTRTGHPEPTTRQDRRQLRSGEKDRRQAADARTRDFGEIPF